MRTMQRLAMLLALQEAEHVQLMTRVGDELAAAEVTPDPTCEPENEPSRKRAQWKNETNYRGRNR